MGNKFIRNYIAKRVAGRSDDGIMITLSDPKKIDFQVAMMEDLLMRNGIDPRTITSENQFKGILNLLKSLEKGQAQSSGITGTKSAEIFNIEGRSLDPNKPIMGGTQTGKELSPELSERLRGTNTQRMKQKIADRKIESDEPPPGSRGGDDDIAAPVQSAEESLRDMTEAEIKANLEAQNKKGIENILKRKNREDVYGLEDYDTTNMSEIKKEIIRTETKLGNLNPNLPGFRERAKPLIDKITALQKKLREDKAKGGRIGFGGGSDMGTVADSKGNVGPSKGGYQGGGTGPVERPTGGGGDNNTNYDYTIPKEIAKTVATNTAKTYAKNKAIEKLGLGGIFGMAPQVAAVLGIINSVRNPQINEEDMQFATGGRVGLKDGMNRRTFLKILGGAVSIPIIGKFFKPVKVGKTVKKLPVIQTEDVAGKPEWFDQLVNKVILEGDDVTKNFATKDREIVHTKKLNDTDEVTVYRDLETDSVRVEYKSPDNMMEETVDLSYKKTLPDESNPRGSTDFEATEMGYVGRADGPDDYFIDAEEVGGQSIKDLDSDVSTLKEYATGQKPTMKEIVQKMKRKEKVKKLNEGDLDAQSDYITARQGDYYDYDDYASGGIARMLGE